VTRVEQEIDARDYTEVFAAGSELSHREAVALVRRDSSRGAAAKEAEGS
jgi:hypothetical protein